MKVKDLIAELEKLPQNMWVGIESDHSYQPFRGFCQVTVGVGDGEVYDAYEEEHLMDESHTLTTIVTLDY